MLIAIVVAALGLFVIGKVRKFRKGLELVDYIPGIRCIFGTLTPVGVLGPTRWWNPGVRFTWSWRNSIYEQYDTDSISIVPLLFGKAAIYTRSLDFLREVALPVKQRFVKPESVKLVLRLWGENVVSTDGEPWKRHRRIIAPAFTAKTYDGVWNETARFYREMVEAEGWSTHVGPIEIPIINDISNKLALLVAASQMFGFPVQWTEPLDVPGKMSVQQAFRIFAATTQIRVITPKFLFKIPFFKRLREIETAYEVVAEFMNSNIKERKKEAAAGGGIDEPENVFSRLVLASEKEKTAGGGLTDDELRGSFWAMLFAGHETTAHTLAAALGFLALYTEEQGLVYEAICDILPPGVEPTVEYYARLDKVRAVFLEAIRLFPSGSMIIREASEDMVFDAAIKHSEPDKRYQYLIKKDVQVVVDLIGLNYNAAIFPDPEAFKPSRWYETDTEILSSDSKSTPRETTTPEASFTSFYLGPRVCIGKKFAMVEATCFLTLLLRDFKLSIGGRREGEGREEWRRRVMQGRTDFTFHPTSIPVVLERRA